MTGEFIGKTYFPSSRMTRLIRVPFKPCSRISRTRLTGEVSRGGMHRSGVADGSSKTVKAKRDEEVAIPLGGLAGP